MKKETVPILCAPGTLEPLQLLSEPGANPEEYLGALRSKEKFFIRDGIPLLVNPEKVTGLNRRYQNFYNKIAPFYDGGIKIAALLTGKNEEKSRMEYLRELALKPKDRVLEVSSGTGANLRFLPVKGELFGADISWGMLAKSRKNFAKWGLEVELILANAEELPFKDETFDTVFHVGGINAFGDRKKAIEEMIRVAKPGSKLLIVDETSKLMKSLSWIPGIKKMLRKYGERFEPPADLVSKSMKEIRVNDIAEGNLYCLTFVKPS